MEKLTFEGEDVHGRNVIMRQKTERALRADRKQKTGVSFAPDRKKREQRLLELFIN